MIQVNITPSDIRSVETNLISALIGTIIGFSFGTSSRFFRRTIIKRKVRIANLKSFRKTSLLSVSGSRFELRPSQIPMSISDETLRFSFPSDFIETMLSVAPDFVLNPSLCTSTVRTLRDQCRTIIPDLDDLLNAATVQVAEEFLQRAGTLQRLFNGDLFHVLRMNPSATTDEKEDPIVPIEFYTTDYFSHQVIHKTFTMIRNRPHVRKMMEEGDISPGLRFLLNGFGLNCLVCACTRKNGVPQPGALIFGKRGTRVAKNCASGKWHVSANEALSKTDVEDQKISLERWVRRALHEELAIREAEVLRTFYFNVFIGVEDMQPGMVGLVMCDLDPNELLTRVTASQDGLLEYDDYYLLSFDDASISDALKKGGLPSAEGGLIVPFSPSADNALRNILARGTSAFLNAA